MSEEEKIEVASTPTETKESEKKESTPLPQQTEQPKPKPQTEEHNGKKVKKSVVPRLKASCIPIVNLRNVAKEELQTILDNIKKKSSSSTFTLVLDPSVVGPLTLIVPFSTLKEKGVDDSIHTTAEPFNTNLSTVVYFVRPRIDIMKDISKQILNFSDKKRVFIYFVPRKNLISEITLQKTGVYDLIEQPIGEFTLDLIPYDNDLLSMEVPFGFKELQTDGDNSTLYHVARSIMKIQALYGVIPTIKYVGEAGERISKMLLAMKKKLGQEHTFRPDFQIGEIVIIDRAVDLISPLITQLTYEGLIDELYGINNNLIGLEFLLPYVKKGQKPPSRTKMPLNDDDDIFYQIRHKNFNAIGKQLHKEAAIITEQYDEKKKMHDKKVDVKTIKEFVDKLPRLQMKHEDLGFHISIAQAIRDQMSKNTFRRTLEVEQNILKNKDEEGCVEFIEELIVNQEPLQKVLRLICLMSVVQAGLSEKTYDFLRKELIHSYGYVIMLSLFNLEYTGLLKRKNGKEKGTWEHVSKILQLQEEEEVDAENPNSTSFVFSGVKPLSVTLIEKFLDKWNELKLVMPFHEIGEKYQTGSKIDVTDRKLMVFFVGGVTHAEISALRFLSKIKGSDIIIGTTKLITGSSLLTSMLDEPEIE